MYLVAAMKHLLLGVAIYGSMIFITGCSYTPLTPLTAPTTTSLSSAITDLSAYPLTATVGDAIRLEASISIPGQLVTTGTVAFYHGLDLLGTVAVSKSGIATYTTDALSEGTNMITAQYSVPGTSMTSTSSAVAINMSAVASQGPTRSISEWATCDGVTDDYKGVEEAFAAAKNHAFTLDIDCPVYVHVGRDISRPIYIDNGTSVNFTGNGLVILDNALIPSFVIANSSGVTLTNWKIKYVGTLPLNPVGAGFYYNGSYYTTWARGQPSNAFNDVTRRAWLSNNRNIIFDPGANPNWPGPSDVSSIFYICGSSSDINVKNMYAYAPLDAAPDNYVPMLFAFVSSQSSDQEVSANTPMMVPYYSVPNHMTFSGITLDGTLFGFQGNAQDVTINNVVSHRYSDLQDSDGGDVGGVGVWFSPPHLFYLNYKASGDPSLYNHNIVIKNVIDYGQRTGLPRVFYSGSNYSLKLGGNDNYVSNYISLRPDGFMDVLDSTDLVLTNIRATYDSSFLSGHYPIVRFPDAQYNGVSFDNVTFSDSALNTDTDPIWGNPNPADSDISFNSTTIMVNHWTGSTPPEYSFSVPGTRPYFGGAGNRFDIQIKHQ